MVQDMGKSGGIYPGIIRQSGRVEWFRVYMARDDAKCLPLESCMGSPVWITDYLTDHPPLGFWGPVANRNPKTPSPWKSASRKYPAPDGQHFHGQPEWFLTGLPDSAITHGPRTELCGEPLIDGEGCSCAGGTGTIQVLPPYGIQGVGDLGLDGVGTVPISVLVLDKVSATLTSLPVPNYPLSDNTCFQFVPILGTVFSGFTGGQHGRIAVIENIGSLPMYLENESGAAIPANRIICLDGIRTRLWPRFATTLQYDGGFQRWRELGNVPYISAKGDLLTARSQGEPSILTASQLPGQVLNAEPSANEGMRWGDGGGGTGGAGDLNYFRDALTPDSVWGERWYGNSYMFGANLGPTGTIEDLTTFHPFVNPSGFPIDAIAVCLHSTNTDTDDIVLGIYDSPNARELRPLNRLFVQRLTVAGTGLQIATITPALRLRPAMLYWLAFQKRQLSGVVFIGTTIRPDIFYPLYGMASDFSLIPPRVLLHADRSWDGSLPVLWNLGFNLLENWAVPAVGVRYPPP